MRNRLKVYQDLLLHVQVDQNTSILKWADFVDGQEMNIRLAHEEYTKKKLHRSCFLGHDIMVTLDLSP